MPDSAKKVEVAANYGHTPLSFEANHGQTDSQVRFFSRGSGYSIFLTDSAAVFSLTKSAAIKPSTAKPGAPAPPPSYKTESVRMELVNPSPAPRLVEEDRLPGNVNYFIGKDTSQWHSDVPTFRKVRYEGVYPGVDLVYHGNQSQLEFDFVVAPNADPKPIRLHFAGAQKLSIDEAGNLKVVAHDGNVEFHKPVLYQEIAGKRQDVQGSFTLAANSTVSFTLGAYDRTQPLVIDPVLTYSTYFGGAGGVTSSGEIGGQGTSIAVDSSGNIYIAGLTASISFPVTNGAFQTSSGNGKATTLAAFPFVSKLDPTGTSLLYSTYISGSGFNAYSNYNYFDSIANIAVDTAGNLYFTGSVYSTDFPITSNALQLTRKTGYSYYNPSCFVGKLNASGSALLYSTYLGGSGNGTYGDGCSRIAIDSAGNAYVMGYTYSRDFPVTTGAFQLSNKSASYQTVFVSKINPLGTSLVYSTYLGGSLSDIGNAIVVDSSGDAFVGGLTASTDFPATAGAYQTINYPRVAGRGNAGFIAELNRSGSGLVFSTYLAGTGRYSSGMDQVTSLALDAAGNIYATGLTQSLDFPTTSGAVQTSNKAGSGNTNYNSFVSKLSPSGSSLLYSTYLGSTKGETGFGNSPLLQLNSPAIALDASGNIFTMGTTYGTDFPVTSNAFQAQSNASGSTPTNIYLTELSSAGALLYSSYFGGSVSQTGNPYSAGDQGWALALDSTGHAYLTGLATSNDLAITPGAYQSSKPAYTSAFIAKFLFDSSTSISTITTLVSSRNPQAPSTSITFTSSVQSVAGTGVPTGSVTFSVDGSSASTVPLSTAGRATFTIATLTGGSHTITASYPGDAHNAASSNTMTEIIAGTAAKVTVVSGSGQTTINGTFFAAPIVTLVVDANGFPVPNVTVSYNGTGLSTASSPSPVTDTNGRAYVYLIPSSTGSLTGTATVSGVNTPAYYSLTSTAGLGTVATPTFSVASGVYITTQTVSLSDTTAGASIYYTINGNPPTTNSYVYSGPITVSTSESIQAIAVATNYTPSAIATATYTINSVTNPQALQFVAITPCRIADTRNATGAFGGPIIAAGVAREFDIPQSACGIPATALAYSLNVTVVPPGPLGFLTLWPTGLTQPNSSTLNSDGRVKANAAIIPAGNKGGVNVYVSSASHVILDINGYFVAAGSTNTALAFYPVNPCRIADTRNATGSLGGPFIAAQGSRAFPVQSSSCGIPSTAQAYSLNVTAVPRTKVLNYITTWPTGQSQPNVSTLNASTGAVTANAAIVPAGTNGNVSFYASDATDLVLDINGYFAPLVSGGLSLYAANPCRVIDTRSASGVFNGSLVIPVATSTCAPPSSAQAYVLNATVVPPGPVGYLSLWPDSQAQPQVSTLNANDGVITSNLAIVPVVNGKIDAYTSSLDQLILDISSYFAP